MQCPICKQNLVMSERQGVEIDYCPQCRGVWLDRGELDKLLEKSASFDAPRPMQSQPQFSSQPQQYHQSHDYKHHDHDNHNSYNPNQHHQKKKESWLGEIFDF